MPRAPLPVVNPLLHDESTEQLDFGFGDTGVVQRSPQPSTKRRPCVWLLRDVWQVDVSTCELCGGAMKGGGGH